LYRQSTQQTSRSGRKALIFDDWASDVGYVPLAMRMQAATVFSLGLI